MITKLILIIFILVNLSSSKIVTLNQQNLQKFSKDNSYWLIQISDTKCSQCSSHENQLQKISFMLDGAVKVGKINSKLIPSLKIKNNPTYMFTRSDQPQNSKPFQSKFNRKQIIDFTLSQLSSYIKQRQDKSGTSSNKKTQQKRQSRQSQSQSSHSSSSVIQLNDKSFGQKVLKSKDAWLVQFYSPGCGHCRNFQPQYSKLPKLIGTRVHISRIDGSKNQQYMGKYQVKGFPTVLLFDTNDKQTPIPYNGQRTAQSVVQWLKTQQINEQKRQLLEFNQKIYSNECHKNILCFLFILDKKSDKNKLKFVQKVMATQSSKPFRFFYSERLNKFESDLMIDDRQCPKMVSIWESMNSYKIYNGQLNQQVLNQYLQKVHQRKGWIKYSQKLVNGLFVNTQL